MCTCLTAFAGKNFLPANALSGRHALHGLQKEAELGIVLAIFLNIMYI
jgi:hypothetical protein